MYYSVGYDLNLRSTSELNPHLVFSQLLFVQLVKILDCLPKFHLTILRLILVWEDQGQAQWLALKSSGLNWCKYCYLSGAER